MVVVAWKVEPYCTSLGYRDVMLITTVDSRVTNNTRRVTSFFIFSHFSHALKHIIAALPTKLSSDDALS